MNTLNDALDTLCDLLDDELERQENVLAITEAQGQAARAHDVEHLEAKTAALTACIDEGVQAEIKRLETLRVIVDTLGLPEEQQTLTHLIGAVSDPWSRRLAEFQARMQEIIAQTRGAVRENNRVMRGSLRVINGTMAILARHLPLEGEGYDAKGDERSRGARAPSMLDRKG